MSNIELYSCFTQFLCELLNLRTLTIYIVQYEKDNIVLYDDKLNIISYDERDVGERTNDVTIIPKQNTLYINKDFSSDTLKTLVLISKRLRFMYQLKQVYTMKKGNLTEVDSLIVTQWLYELKPSQIHKKREYYNPSSPAELDRKSFAWYIMGIVFHHNICFEIDENNQYDIKNYNEAKRRIKAFYPRSHIQAVYNKCFHNDLK